MKPVDQVIFEENRGDCFRCCVASILELPREEVPNFTDAENWYGAAEEWLDERGYRLLEITFPDASLPKTVLWCGAGLCIMGGVSPRRTADGGKKYHAVVADATGWGLKIVHDPHPSRAGLLDSGYRSVRFLVPLQVTP